MHRFVLAMLALTLVAPCAMSTTEHEREVANLVAVRTASTGAILTWQPTLGATGYDIFRVLPGEAPLLVGQTGLTFFADPEAPDVPELAYVVIATDGTPGAPPTESRGACISASARGASLTARNCMPDVLTALIEA